MDIRKFKDVKCLKCGRPAVAHVKCLPPLHGKFFVCGYHLRRYKFPGQYAITMFEEKGKVGYAPRESLRGIGYGA